MTLQQIGLHHLAGVKQELLSSLLKGLANLGLQRFQGHAIRAYTDGDRRFYGSHGRLTSWLLVATFGGPTLYSPPQQ